MTRKTEAVRPQPQEATPAGKPAPLALPQAGGSWIRRADGRLVREGVKEG